jgi:glucose 1-dehydrogenase
VALITGSAHGIGRGIALAFAREGARIVVNDLHREPSTGQADDVARLVAEAGGEVEVCLGDASSTADMERVVATTVERFGRLDILVNNANPGRRDPTAPRAYMAATEDQLYQGYFLPFKAAYVNTQLAARRMIAQGDGGQVITITSVHQERPWQSDSIYGPMKAALRRLVMSQARELAPHGIRVNAIAPGFFPTAMNAPMVADPERLARIIGRIPMGRAGAEADIAGVAVFLASAAAGYVTGQVIPLDGGMTCW